MWLGWLGHHPVHQNVVGSIPSQDTYLGFGFSPRLGHVLPAANQYLSLTSMSPSLSLSLSCTLPLSLKAMKKMSLGKDKKEKEKQRPWEN